MPKTVTATQMQNNFGSLTNWVINSQDTVIVESRGNPKVVLIPFAEYQKLSQWREQARRKQVLQKMKNLRKEVQAQNKNLTPTSAKSLADDISQQTIRRMIKQGKVKFEEQ